MEGAIKQMSKEKNIEQKTGESVKNVAGRCSKFVRQRTRAAQEQLRLCAMGKIAFVEVKAPGEKPRPLQVSRIKQIRNLGFKVYVLDDESKIGGIIDEIQST